MTIDLSALARITDTLIDKWDAAADKITQAYLRISDASILNWEDAASKAHTHYNKSFLDSLNETSIRTYAGSGEVNQATSLGGIPIYTGKSGETLTFRGISAGTGVTFSETGNSITINSSTAEAGHSYYYAIVAISAGTTYRGTLYATDTIIEKKSVGYSSISSYFNTGNIYIDATDELWYETDFSSNQTISPSQPSEDRIIFTPTSPTFGVLKISIWRDE